jgi:hypothetical protein
MSTTNVTNLALNKKGTKVKVVGISKVFNILGTSIQWLPPLTYLAIKFDLFTFENEGYAITGWGAVFVISLFLAFRQKIKDAYTEYGETFGVTWNRIKAGNIALGIATILFIVYFASFSLFTIFFIFAGSTYISLFVYAPYDKLAIKRKEMQTMLDKQNKEKDFVTLTNQFKELEA